MDAQLKQLEEAAKASGDIKFQLGVGFARMLKNVADFPLLDWPRSFSPLQTSSSK